MPFLAKLKPKFWDHHDVSAGPYQSLFNFRRKWKLVILLTTPITLVPLLFMTWLEYDITFKAVESEIRIQTARNVSEIHQAVAYFLSGNREVMDFILEDNLYEDLCDQKRLTRIFQSLRKIGVGGFTDLGVIDARGRQQAYVGPFGLDKTDFGNDRFFQEVVRKGTYISDMMIGSHHFKHLAIAIKRPLPDGSFFVLRATLDTGHINRLLEQLELDKNGDAFLVNTDGWLQTQSRFYGDAPAKLPLLLPQPTDKARVYETVNQAGVTLLIGYVYIPETSFILMVIGGKDHFMQPYYNVRLTFYILLFISVIIMLCVILGMATYLVSKIYAADQKRIAVLHEVEYSNKMASIGRLASGVAHEINNPLAIINEKAGLIKDLATIYQDCEYDPRLLSLLDSIVATVKRCRSITHRLLNFARHMEINVEIVNLREVVEEIMAFLKKDAERRRIDIITDIPDDLPQLESDQGNIHQIFLNIINNAFAALKQGGRLQIKIRCESDDFMVITFRDNGCGISEDDLRKVFEPFFTTKFGDGSTGLGLSLTYGMIEEMGGRISVTSQLNHGTCFTVRLPLKIRED